MLPSELRSLLDQIDACEAQAERLVADLDEEGVNWIAPPAAGAGQWSVAQCLDHLALMNEFYLRGWSDDVSAAARAEQGPFEGLRPTVIGRWFARSLEPPVRFKTKAIAATTPGPRLARAGLVDRYKAAHEGYRHLVRSSAAVDVNRLVRRNPLLKSVKMRLSTVLLVVPAHDRRHLWQATNVKLAYAKR